jgi:hypothetical protein
MICVVLAHALALGNRPAPNKATEKTATIADTAFIHHPPATIRSNVFE